MNMLLSARKGHSLMAMSNMHILLLLTSCMHVHTLEYIVHVIIIHLSSLLTSRNERGGKCSQKLLKYRYNRTSTRKLSLIFALKHVYVLYVYI